MRECGDRIRRERAMSPRLVLRRVLVLSEGRQYREAAAVLSKLSTTGLAAVANDLPLDIFVDGLPHSAQLLETLIAKLVLTGQRPNLNVEPVLWQLVKLFACHDDPTLKTKVGRLARVLVQFQPDFHRILSTRRKSLEVAVQGLGGHGLTPDASGFTHLHLALKTELLRHIEAYKNALHRLDELGLSAAQSKKPVDASHQRLLSLHHGDVQKRLIENKTLLTLLDKPTLQQLSSLIETLATRVQTDKEALFCVSQLKRVQQLNDDKPVATLLMAFSRGCAALLELMQLPDSPCNSDGYHSEPEADAEQGKDTIGRFASLYYQSRPRALEALDSLPELCHATQLKSKILFSVVVLAFRTCKRLREMKLHETFHSLHVDADSSIGRALRENLLKCLAANADSYPLGDAELQVRSLLFDTLKEYNCLQTCTPLHRYIGEVTRNTWFMVNQEPYYELDIDFQTPVHIKPECHQRHHSSNRSSDTVISFLWPALIQKTKKYVHKAVVITG